MTARHGVLRAGSTDPPPATSEFTALEGLLTAAADVAEAARPEQRLLWRCARVAPSPATLAEIRALGATLDADGWARVVARAEREGVENLLFTQIAAADLLPIMPTAVIERLRERWGAVTLLARRLELRLEQLLPELAAAGVAAIPLKGVGLARRAYGGSLSLRPVTDIDLRVRPSDAAAWRAVFPSAGFAPLAGRGDPLSGHALRFHETQFVSVNGLRLEAHLSLCRLPAYRRAFAEAAIWRRAQPTTIHGVAALGLALEDELRYLSLHYAALHHASRLIWLVDVAELLRTRGNEVVWERLVEETIAWRCAAPLAITLQRAAALLDAPAPPWALERLTSAALTRPERRAWLAGQAPMSDWRRFLAQTLALETTTQRLLLLRSGGASLAKRLRQRRQPTNRL